MLTRNCKICGKEFTTYPSLNQRFCSYECANISKRKKIKTHCLNCNKEFEYQPSHNRKYCSVVCRDLHKAFIDRRAKTQFKKGDIRISGKNNYWFGKDMSGTNNGMWQGGITPENKKIRTSIEYRLWREAVFARDNWTCQKYGTRGGKLHPHHIQNFSQYHELRLAIDNGITLSEKAHKEFHQRYGIKNNTKEQLEEFLNNN